MKVFLNFYNFYFQVYTAKSLYVNSEILDDAQLQQLSDNPNGTIESEIKINHLPPSTTARISSLFNFKLLNAMESSEDDINNEIEKSDVIEIEVPLIGSEFMRRSYNVDELKVDEESTKDNAETETSTTFSDLSKPDGALTFSSVFKSSAIHPTTFKNAVETTTQVRDDSVQVRDSPQVRDTVTAFGEAATLYSDAATKIEDSPAVQTTTKSNEIRNYVNSHFYNFDNDLQSMESKLMEQWKAADSMIDASPEIEVFTTVKPRVHPKFPFNVKIVENSDDKRKSCKSKTSCSQVSFAGSSQSDIDPQFYTDYSDEDLVFRSIPGRFYEKPNEIRPKNAKRAADDIITPAPRFPPMPQVRGLNLPALRKPGFIERLESESSIERSERVNKNLDNLMRVISVWAQVDKFVSDRARGAIKRIAYLTDDYDDFTLGSKHRGSRLEPKRAVDEPFT